MNPGMNTLQFPAVLVVNKGGETGLSHSTNVYPLPTMCWLQLGWSLNKTEKAFFTNRLGLGEDREIDRYTIYIQIYKQNKIYPDNDKYHKRTKQNNILKYYFVLYF